MTLSLIDKQKLANGTMTATESQKRFERPAAAMTGETVYSPINKIETEADNAAERVEIEHEMKVFDTEWSGKLKTPLAPKG